MLLPFLHGPLAASFSTSLQEPGSPFFTWVQVANDTQQ